MIIGCQVTHSFIGALMFLMVPDWRHGGWVFFDVRGNLYVCFLACILNLNFLA